MTDEKRLADCIYCGASGDSGAHIAQASIGGRRTRNGMECRKHDQLLSQVDGVLADQMRLITGFLGVRNDHRDAPSPAEVDTELGKVLIDAAGRPTFSGTHVIEETPLGNGRKHVSVRLSEQDEAEFKAKILAQDPDATFERERRRTIFLEPIAIESAFGGIEMYRAIAHLALSYLADREPALARLPRLWPFKEFVLGERKNLAGEPQFVWFPGEDECPLPKAEFENGHQVLLRSDTRSGEIWGRIRLFDGIDFAVWFGVTGAEIDRQHLVQLDPLAERAPHDRRTSEPPLAEFPPRLTPPRQLGGIGGDESLKKGLAALMERIATSQWTHATTGLRDRLNACGARDEVVAVLLDFDFFSRQLLADAVRWAKSQPLEVPGAAELLSDLIDSEAPVHRPSEEMNDEFRMLADEIQDQLVGRVLAARPVSDTTLRDLLQGNGGLKVAFNALAERVLAHLETDRRHHTET